MLFIGTQFSNLYTVVDTPDKAAWLRSNQPTQIQTCYQLPRQPEVIKELSEILLEDRGYPSDVSLLAHIFKSKLCSGFIILVNNLGH